MSTKSESTWSPTQYIYAHQVRHIVALPSLFTKMHGKRRFLWAASGNDRHGQTDRHCSLRLSLPQATCPTFSQILKPTHAQDQPNLKTPTFLWSSQHWIDLVARRGNVRRMPGRQTSRSENRIFQKEIRPHYNSQDYGPSILAAVQDHESRQGESHWVLSRIQIVRSKSSQEE